MSGSRKVSSVHFMGLGRLHLGCCTHFWAPHYQKDTDEPEKVCWGGPNFMIKWLKKTAYESCAKMNGLALKPLHGEPSNSLQTLPESKEKNSLAWSRGLIFGQENYENQIAGATATQCWRRLLVEVVETAGSLAVASPLLGKALNCEKRLLFVLGSEGKLLFIGVIKLTYMNEMMQ